jgi:hypothetical protein
VSGGPFLEKNSCLENKKPCRMARLFAGRGEKGEKGGS